MYFNSAFGGGGLPGSGASAFTSPGLDPSSLAMLMAMQGGGASSVGGPQVGAPQAKAPSSVAPPPQFSPIVPPKSMMESIGPLLQANPSLLKSIFGAGGIGGGLESLFSQYGPTYGGMPQGGMYGGGRDFY